MALIKVGGCALDIDRVYAIVRRSNDKGEKADHVHAVVYFGDSGTVEVHGDDARAVLRLVENFPDFDAYRQSLGSRVEQSEPGLPHGGKPHGGKLSG